MTIEKVQKVMNFLRDNMRAIAIDVVVETHELVSNDNGDELISYGDIDFIIKELAVKMVRDVLWTGFAIHVHDGNKEESQTFIKYVATKEFFKDSMIGILVNEYIERDMGFAMALSQVFSNAMTKMTESIFEEYLRQN